MVAARRPITGFARIGPLLLESWGLASRPGSRRRCLRCFRCRELPRPSGASLFSRECPPSWAAAALAHELCQMLRVLSRYCGSTALALAMHTHQVAIPAWRWRHEGAAVGPFFARSRRS